MLDKLRSRQSVPLALISLMALTGVLIVAAARQPVPAASPRAALPPPSCLSAMRPTAREPFARLSAPFAYRPPARMFGLLDSWGTISSGIGGESGLIGWTWPVADTDLMLPCGAHESARLPGDNRDIYTLAYTGYIEGSGLYESWVHGYARFAFLHLVSIRYAAGARVRGGTIVGTTGWPIWGIYGNGVAGPINAHLCVVYNQAAKDWFYTVQFRAKPKPPAFPYRTWSQWLAQHHRKPVSPYFGAHRLRPEASYWWHHAKARCGPVHGTGTWHRRGQYMRWQFSDCILYRWPRHPSWRIKVADS